LVERSAIQESLVEPYIIMRRVPYEEPNLLNIELSASNGVFAGTVDFYCGPGDLLEIATALSPFPTKIPDDYVFEYGSPGSGSNSYLLLRAYTLGPLGHCGLHISMNRNCTPPNEGVCEFSIPAEPAALNKLGLLLRHFAQLEHLKLKWTPTLAELDGSTLTLS
jgi:hypothetical protein